MMDLSFYRQQSAIQDWMEHSRSNAPPTLDEDSAISDVPLPNPIFTSLAEDNENLEQWSVTRMHHHPRGVLWLTSRHQSLKSHS
jgi:hypothetical protein